jgi:hypothetical protein
VSEQVADAAWQLVLELNLFSYLIALTVLHLSLQTIEEIKLTANKVAKFKTGKSLRIPLSNDE